MCYINLKLIMYSIIVLIVYSMCTSFIICATNHSYTASNVLILLVVHAFM